MELISVIVPVYKVEAYLDRCIRSITEQTYRELEIILVDDGSPDNCPAMCDAWAAKDPRIKVIHKANGGLSDARNAGMAIASGSYIGFVDSDDHISPDMYRLLLERMIADGSNIAACGVEMIYEDGTPSRMLTPAGSHLLDQEQAMKAIIQENLLKQPVWYKLYTADVVRNMPFPVGKCHEDVFWSWQVIAKSQKVSIIDTPCYYYLQRNGSIMSRPFPPERLDALEARCIRQEYLEHNMPHLAAYGRLDLLFICLYQGQMVLRHMDGDVRKACLSRLNGVAKQYRITNEDLRLLPAKQRLWVLLANATLNGTCKLRNRLRIGL